MKFLFSIVIVALTGLHLVQAHECGDEFTIPDFGNNSNLPSNLSREDRQFLRDVFGENASWGNSSGGGEYIISKNNPWFFDKEKANENKEVRWCLNHNPKYFSLSAKQARNEVEKGIFDIVSQFEKSGLRSTFGTFLTKFVYDDNCRNADLEFILGNLDDPRIKLMKESFGEESFKKIVGTAIRTNYSQKTLKGKGFIYLGADLGKLKYEADFLFDVDEVGGFWSYHKNIDPDFSCNAPCNPHFNLKKNSVGALRAVVAHEVGHVMGLRHESKEDWIFEERLKINDFTPKNLMELHMPAQTVARGYVKNDSYRHMINVFGFGVQVPISKRAYHVNMYNIPFNFRMGFEIFKVNAGDEGYVENLVFEKFLWGDDYKGSQRDYDSYEDMVSQPTNAKIIVEYFHRPGELNSKLRLQVVEPLEPFIVCRDHFDRKSSIINYVRDYSFGIPEHNRNQMEPVAPVKYIDAIYDNGFDSFWEEFNPNSRFPGFGVLWADSKFNDCYARKRKEESKGFTYRTIRQKEFENTVLSIVSDHASCKKVENLSLRTINRVKVAGVMTVDRNGKSVLKPARETNLVKEFSFDVCKLNVIQFGFEDGPDLRIQLPTDTVRGKVWEEIVPIEYGEEAYWAGNTPPLVPKDKPSFDVYPLFIDSKPFQSNPEYFDL
jgi:hypothetical protein